jgi:hypothetical protein
MEKNENRFVVKKLGGKVMHPRIFYWGRRLSGAEMSWVNSLQYAHRYTWDEARVVVASMQNTLVSVEELTS